MRLAVLLLASLLVVPLASAQKQGVLVLRFPPIPGALHAGEQMELNGTAELVADATAFDLHGVQVHYAVVRSPTWASAYLGPDTDTFRAEAIAGMPGTFDATRPVHLLLLVHDDLGRDGAQVGVLEIAAQTEGNAWGSVVAHATIPLLVTSPAPTCESATLSTQTSEAVPLDATPAAAILGVAALLGLVVLLVARRSGVAGAALALLALGLVVPAGDAQRNGTLVFASAHLATMTPASLQNTTTVLTLTADAGAFAAQPGIPVAIQVTHAPPWARVVVTPENGLFRPSAALGPTFQSSIPVTIQLVVGDVNFTGAAVDIVELTALTTTSLGSIAGVTRVAVKLDAAPACPKHVSSMTLAPSATPAPAPAPPTETSTLTVQTSSASLPGAGVAVVAGCAVAGALGGFVLSRRRR